jgi:hypothetical protein
MKSLISPLEGYPFNDMMMVALTFLDGLFDNENAVTE